MTYTYQVVDCAPEFPGRQRACNVVRSDGNVVRLGMMPEYAEVDCALLNRASAEGWTAAQYHAAKAA